LQLHREFCRAGSDIAQAFTFYASEDKLDNRGNDAGKKIGVKSVNQASCDLAKQVSKEFGCLWLGGLSQTPTYLSDGNKEKVQEEFRKQTKVFVENKADFLLAEYFEHVEEAVWAVEVLKETGLPVAASLCIGPEGDIHGVPTGECAVRLVKAGADIVGINCHFDPFVCLKAVKNMKEGLDAAGLKAHLMIQPLAFHTPDCGKQGFIDLPEFPFALEPRILTRWDMHRYAREAYDLGVRYIGGCCGFEPYHIRAIAQELAKERGRECIGAEKHEEWGKSLVCHTKPWVRARAGREYWEKLEPATGRPYSQSLARPDNWEVSRGHTLFKQHVEATSAKEMSDVKSFRKG
ncbi:betaine--homocysteine S-methyltransferase 1, partial [Paramuricea clavata]